LTKRHEKKSKLLVVCYHCRKTLPKEVAYYIPQWDAYYCPKDYARILDGKPVRKPNWRKRGV